MHKEFDELCILHHAGELSGERSARFEAHRPGCAECAELLEALGAASKAADLAAVSLPEGRLAEIAHAALGSREPGARDRGAGSLADGWLLGLRRLCGATVLAAAFAVGLYVTSWQGSGPVPDLAWSNGIDSDIEVLTENLYDFSDAMEVSASGEELDSDIRALEDSAESLMRQLSGA